MRRKCSKQDIKMLVVKNTLLKKAFENLGIDVSQFGNSLKLNTALFLSNGGPDPDHRRHRRVAGRQRGFHQRGHAMRMGKSEAQLAQ